jgi:hypothetical protein
MAVRIASLTFDCADAHRVARFWSAAVGRPLTDEAHKGHRSNVPVGSEIEFSFRMRNKTRAGEASGQ